VYILFDLLLLQYYVFLFKGFFDEKI